MKNKFELLMQSLGMAIRIAETRDLQQIRAEAGHFSFNRNARGCALNMTTCDNACFENKASVYEVDVDIRECVSHEQFAAIGLYDEHIIHDKPVTEESFRTAYPRDTHLSDPTEDDWSTQDRAEKAALEEVAKLMLRLTQCNQGWQWIKNVAALNVNRDEDRDEILRLTKLWNARGVVVATAPTGKVKGMPDTRSAVELSAGWEKRWKKHMVSQVFDSPLLYYNIITSTDCPLRHVGSAEDCCLWIRHLQWEGGIGGETLMNDHLINWFEEPTVPADAKGAGGGKDSSTALAVDDSSSAEQLESVHGANQAAVGAPQSIQQAENEAGVSASAAGAAASSAAAKSADPYGSNVKVEDSDGPASARHPNAVYLHCTDNEPRWYRVGAGEHAHTALCARIAGRVEFERGTADA